MYLDTCAPIFKLLQVFSFSIFLLIYLSFVNYIPIVGTPTSAPSGSPFPSPLVQIHHSYIFFLKQFLIFIHIVPLKMIAFSFHLFKFINKEWDNKMMTI